ASGLVFATGLTLSGMTNPAKILAFLDITGRWDPSLLLVMGAAVATHLPFALWAKRASHPLVAQRFAFPARDALDGSLFFGAALFGVGWGMQGYCPGPAIVALASGGTVPLVFVATMIVGLLLPGRFRSNPRSSTAPHAEAARDARL
ncbi:MAG TPA: DUF6691 family protein, partial [Polyangiaceae bacterium]